MHVAMLSLCWAYVGLCWLMLGLCWAYVGPMLALCWAFGRPADVDIVVFLGTAPYACGYVEPLLGLCWAMLAHVGAMLAYVGPMLALCWAFGRPADVDIVVFLGTAPYACGYDEAGRRGHSGISRHRALCMWLC